jgi:hypothetical protein
MTTGTGSQIHDDTVSLLHVERAISERKGALIIQLQKLADDYQIGKVIERAPLKNVLAVATEAGADPEEVANFVRYQLGRSTRNEIWVRRSEKRRQSFFAEDLVKELEELSGPATEIASRVRGSGDAEAIAPIHIKLIQLYLGYLGRYHTYLKWDEERRKTQGGSR